MILQPQHKQCISGSADWIKACWGLNISVCVCVCLCVYLRMCVCVRVCVGAQLHHLAQVGLPSRMNGHPGGVRASAGHGGGMGWSHYHDNSFSQIEPEKDAVSADKHLWVSAIINLSHFLYLMFGVFTPLTDMINNTWWPRVLFLLGWQQSASSSSQF